MALRAGLAVRLAGAAGCQRSRGPGCRAPHAGQSAQPPRTAVALASRGDRRPRGEGARDSHARGRCRLGAGCLHRLTGSADGMGRLAPRPPARDLGCRPRDRHERLGRVSQRRPHVRGARGSTPGCRAAAPAGDVCAVRARGAGHPPRQAERLDPAPPPIGPLFPEAYSPGDLVSMAGFAVVLFLATRPVQKKTEREGITTL